jgi:hypothetical protein
LSGGAQADGKLATSIDNPAVNRPGAYLSQVLIQGPFENRISCVVRCTITEIVATDTDITAIVVAITDMADMVAVDMTTVVLTDTVATRDIVIESLS